MRSPAAAQHLEKAVWFLLPPAGIQHRMEQRQLLWNKAFPGEKKRLNTAGLLVYGK